MVELGMESERDVLDMTWREFQLRRLGWRREQIRQWEHTRQIAYWSGAGTAFDGKKTSIKRFMPLDGERLAPKISEEAQDRFRQAQEEYKRKVEERNANR